MPRDRKRYRGQKQRKPEVASRPQHKSPMSMGNDATSKIRNDQIAEGRRMMLIEQLEEMKKKQEEK